MITFNEALKEYFWTTLLPEKEKIKYNLIQRYNNSVSPRLKKEADVLMYKGKGLFDEYITNQVRATAEIFGLIPKDETWSGPLHSPVQFNDEKE